MRVIAHNSAYMAQTVNSFKAREYSARHEHYNRSLAPRDARRSSAFENGENNFQKSTVPKGELYGEDYNREKFGGRGDLQRELESVEDFPSIVKICLKKSRAFNQIQLGIAFNKIARFFPADDDTSTSTPLIHDESQNTRNIHPVWLAESISQLARRATKMSSFLGPHEIASILHSHAKVSICPNHELLASLSQRGCLTIKDFTPQGISLTLWAFATLGVRPDPRFLGMLQSRALQISSHFDPQNISNYIWAHATLSIKSNESVESLLKEAEKNFPAFSVQECINLFWSLAKLRLQPSKQLFLGMRECLLNSPESINPHCISQFMWSMAKLDAFPGIDLLDVMASRIKACTAQLSPQSVSNIFWAITFFKRNYELPEDIIRVLDLHALNTIDSYNPQCLCTVLHSHAKLMLRPSDALVSAMTGQGLRVMVDFQPHDISMLLWALAKLRITPNKDLVSGLMERTCEVAAEFKPQEVSSMLWSLAMLHIPPDESALAMLSTHMTDHIDGYSPQAMANVMWSFARLRRAPDPALLAAVCRHATAVSGSFEVRAVSMLLWSLARLDLHPGPELLEAMMARARAQAALLDGVDEHNLRWALSRLRPAQD
jgi:hypothetical protein